MRIVVFIFCLFLPFAARAQTYEISVRQADMDAPATLATCDTTAQNPCFLTVPIIPFYNFDGKNDIYLDIAIHFEADKAVADFLWRRECVYAGAETACETGHDIALENGRAHEVLNLMMNNPWREDGSLTNLVHRLALPVARIELSIAKNE